MFLFDIICIFAHSYVNRPIIEYLVLILFAWRFHLDIFCHFNFLLVFIVLTIKISPGIPFSNIGKSCRKTQQVYTTESHEMPSHPLPFFVSSHPSLSHFGPCTCKNYPGTTSTSMRYHLGSICTINGANWENPDANEEDPQGSSRQDLRNALCVRLEVFP